MRTPLDPVAVVADLPAPSVLAKKWRGPQPLKTAPSQELADLESRYLSWMVATRYAEHTVKGAHSDLSWLFRYLGERGVLRVADVTPEVLNDYSLWLRERKNYKHEGRSLAMSHIHHRLTGVKWFFKWLAGQMIVLYDPAEDLELPRLHYGLPQTIVTQEEARKLLDAPDLKSPVGYRDKALLELIYATGIRSGELFKLKVSDLDLKARTAFVRQGKGGKDRLIPLPVLTVGYLKEYIEKVRPRFAAGMKRGDDGTLFLHYTGGRVERNGLCVLFKKYRKLARLDKPVTAMVLRHSIASHLLENGMDMRYIQEFLGHERIGTTQIYAKVTLSGLRKSYNKHHPKERRAGSGKQILDERL